MDTRFPITRCSAHLLVCFILLALLMAACAASGTPTQAPTAAVKATSPSETATNWEVVPAESLQKETPPQPAQQDVVEAWLPLRPDIVLPGIGALVPAYQPMREGIVTMNPELKTELRTTGLQINTARVVQAKEISSDNKYFETVSVAPVLAMQPGGMPAGVPAGARIDFEALPLGQEARRAVNPYVDEATGVQFTAERGSWGDEVVGLVKNRATSACVDPPDENQKLGTGRGAPGEEGVGLAGFAIRATFPAPLAPPATVSAEFQVGVDTVIRIRLFEPGGKEVAFVEDKAGPGQGTCGFPGDERARMTLSVTAKEPVAYAILEQGEASVLVIDNFEFSWAQPNTGVITGMLVVESNAEESWLPPGSYLQRSVLDGKYGAMYLIDAASGKEALKVPLVAGQLIPGRLDVPPTEGPVTMIIPGTKWCLNNSQGWWECFECSFWQRLFGQGMELDVCESYLQ